MEDVKAGNRTDVKYTVNMRAIHDCMLAMSKEEARYYLCGVSIKDVDGMRHYCGTDGHILVHFEEELKYRISLAVFEYMNKNGISVEENTPKYIVDEEVLAAPFSEGKIKHYIKENNFTRLQSILYLWAYNNFSVHSPDDLKDNGRPMYRKLARKLSNLLENSYE